jgi:battenin
MLPMPGAPSSSWKLFWARCQANFEGADPAVCAAFWLFGKSGPRLIAVYPLNYAGLVNNILYVIILSAALDLVGPSIPKATV